MSDLTYTSCADEFATGLRGDLKSYRTRRQAIAIAKSILAQGWQISIADEAISTSSIYFRALSPEGRWASIRVADHSTSGRFQCAGLRNRTGAQIQIAPYTKIDKAVAAIVARAN